MFFDKDHNHKLALDRDQKIGRLERTVVPDDLERIPMAPLQVFGNIA